MEEHIKNIKGKTEAALQTIFNLAGNDNFSNMEMKVVWKLVDGMHNPYYSICSRGVDANKSRDGTIRKNI